MKKLHILFIVLVLASLAVACGKDSASSGGTSGGSASGEVSHEKYAKFITVDVFDSYANYQGMQTGWFAKIVKEKFNMELNIISPNVAGGGDTLYQTRVASGDLGDLILTGADNGRINDLSKYGLLVDMTPYLEGSDLLTRFGDAVASMNGLNETAGIYGIPTEVSSKNPDEPSEGLELIYGPYVRWDLYAELGYPIIGTLEDILPVLKDMQALQPTTESGSKVYGFSLFSDWDGNMMMMGKQPTCLYGYDELGFTLVSADGTDIQSIIDSDSQYIRALNLYFQANQMGLMDPESATQNFDTVYTKYQNGQVLYSPWPWLGQAAFNTMENKNAGKGFMIAPVEDMLVYSYGARPLGGQYFIGVGTKAEDPERLVDFIQWLYSPEGVLASASQTSGTSGPEGLTWEMVDGEPVLTEFGKRAFYESDAELPESWGGGFWGEGSSALNFTTVLPFDINPETGFSYSHTLWDSVVTLHNTPVDKDWQNHMNALTTLEYLQKNDMMIVSPGHGFIAPPESSHISTLRAQVNSIIKEYSWKMVFAKDKAEFDKLLSTMQDTVLGLGYNEVLEVDMANAQTMIQAQRNAVAQ